VALGVSYLECVSEERNQIGCISLLSTCHLDVNTLKENAPSHHMFTHHLLHSMCSLLQCFCGSKYAGLQCQTRTFQHQAHISIASCNYDPGLACMFFPTRIPKYGFGHKTDRQKCYGLKNKGSFGVSAIRLQWTTSRTRIRQKSREQKV